jgi:ATPase subunit of ABC transporter with duplicated ATPase domains
VISHDRYFLNSLSSQYIGLGVNKDCGYLFSDFQQWQQKLQEAKKELKSLSSQSTFSPKEKKRSTREIEQRIEKLEEEIRLTEEKLAVALPHELEKLCKHHLSLKKELDELFEKWEKHY